MLWAIKLTIYFWESTNKQLKFFIIKNRNKLSWNQFVETFKEGIDLRTNSICQDMLGNKVNILMFGFFCDLYIPSSGFKLIIGYLIE